MQLFITIIYVVIALCTIRVVWLFSIYYRAQTRLFENYAVDKSIWPIVIILVGLVLIACYHLGQLVSER